jgi:hypothetical protein
MELKRIFIAKISLFVRMLLFRFFKRYKGRVRTIVQQGVDLALLVVRRLLNLRVQTLRVHKVFYPRMSVVRSFII